MVAKTDYSHDSLVAALKGQDILIISLAVTAPRDLEAKIIEAAADAGVPWVIPNDWGYDLHTGGTFGDDVLLGPARKAAVALLEQKGIKWTGIGGGFWYEYSLGAGDFSFGIDVAAKTVSLFDDGKQKVNVVTFPFTGRAVAALLSLPVSRTGAAADEKVVLDDFANKVAHTSSFAVSQRDILESVLRVTGDKEENWTITQWTAEERYKKGVEKFQKGDREGFGWLLYARSFYKGVENGYFQDKLGLDNERLGLPLTEDLDSYTKLVVESAKA